MDLLHLALIALLAASGVLLAACWHALRLNRADSKVQQTTLNTMRLREELNQLVLDRLPAGVVISDLKTTKILMSNPAGYEPLGFTRDEFVGKFARDLNYWADWNERQRIAGMISSGEYPTLEPVRLRHKDGSPVYGEVSVSRFEFEGRTLGVWLLRDDTATYKTKQELALTLERLEKTLATIPDLISVTDLESGQLIEVNPSWEAGTGISRAEALGRTATELGIWKNPEDRLLLRAALQRDKVVRGLRLVFNNRTTGKDFIAEVSATTFDLYSRPRLLMITRDVTQRETLEMEVRASRDRFAILFANNPTPLGLTDLGSQIQVDANEALLNLLGFPRDEFVGSRSRDIGLWADLNDRKRVIASLSADGHVGPVEAKFRRKDGSVVVCQVQGRVLNIDDQRLALWSAYDLTALREAERQLSEINLQLEHRVIARTQELSSALDRLRLAQEELVRTEKLAALGELVAGVAHELNTPIGNSVTVTSTLQDKANDVAHLLTTNTLSRSALQDFINTTQTASALLMRNLAQAAELVVSFKQVAVDRASEARRPFDLAATVSEVLATLSPALKRQPHHIETAIPPGIELDGYPGPFGQVVSNLVMNAYLHAFSADKPGLLRITAESEADHVTLRVADDGCGIPAAIRHRIFDPFFTTRFGQGGSGLGLHIVHNITTRLLGGRIEVSSDEGAGTTFSLTLPLIAPKEPSAPSQETSALR